MSRLLKLEMNKLFETIYFASSPTLQNIVVSLYGYRLTRQRYGKKSKSFLEELVKNETSEFSDIQEMQNKLVCNLVKHAFEKVPFYQKYCQKTGLSVQDINKIDDIVKLPIITKDMIRENPLFFCAKNYVKKKGTFWLSTSGTSGKPLRIFCDMESRQRHYAFWSRFRQWCGLANHHKRATFFGRIIMAPDKNNPPFWRYDAFGKNYLFSSYHLRDSNLVHYYTKLVEINPPELIGYPSSLYILAKYCKKNRLTGIRPKAVITTAETLLSQQRELLEEVFGCPVFDQYGCTEMVLFVSQCEYGTYHVHPEHGCLEVLNENGEQVDPGEVGRAVCTGFANYAMPLIRYELGDQIIVSDEQCLCGRSFQVVKEIVGRVDDILYSINGRPIPRLSPVFKGILGIFETQIIQESCKSLLINLVSDSSFTAKEEYRLEYEIRKRVGNEINISINKVNEIPKDKNGKFRTVVSRINRK